MEFPGARVGGVRDSRTTGLVEGVLAKLPMFRNVPRHTVATVAGLARTLAARRGAFLARRGDRLPGVIALAYGSGKLALRRRDGEERVVRFLGAGDSFGEAAALQDMPSPVDLVALSDSMAVIVPTAALASLLEVDTRFARNLVGLLSERFLGLLAELESSVQRSALQRLAAYLESIAEPDAGAGTWVARLPASKTAVAARLGVTKETLSRLLRGLAARGTISMDRREIAVRDLAALAQICR